MPKIPESGRTLQAFDFSKIPQATQTPLPTPRTDSPDSGGNGGTVLAWLMAQKNPSQSPTAAAAPSVVFTIPASAHLKPPPTPTAASKPAFAQPKAPNPQDQLPQQTAMSAATPLNPPAAAADSTALMMSRMTIEAPAPSFSNSKPWKTSAQRDQARIQREEAAKKQAEQALDVSRLVLKIESVTAASEPVENAPKQMKLSIETAVCSPY